MSLDRYIEKFQKLKTAVVKGRARPHKPSLLLAIISLVESNRIEKNRISYDQPLLELFQRYFQIVRSDDDALNPLLPFFHLRSDGFFHHKVIQDQEPVYQAIRTPKSARQLSDVIDHAFLDDELFLLLQDVEARTILRETLIQRYFKPLHDELMVLIREEQNIAMYADGLKNGTLENDDSVKEKTAPYRSAAFSRTIREVYDYRCAACGLRLNLNGFYIIDAAHLIPFSESHDDDPGNGIALCKNHHWAMDKFLLVPGSDKYWHASPQLDDRIEGCRDIINLDKRKILLPHKEKYYPKPESLRWRHKRILK